MSQQQQEQQNNNTTNQIFHSSKKEDEQKQINNYEEGTAIQNRTSEGAPPPQKGLDAFFAALANANDNGQKQQEVVRIVDSI